MLTENERFRYVRKTLKLSGEAFGRRLGVTKAAISNIEKGERGLTSQMVQSVCREFGVNRDWLLTGVGDPFLGTTRSEQISSFIGDILANEPEGSKAKLINALAGLDEEEWAVLAKLAQKMVKENEQASDGPPA